MRKIFASTLLLLAFNFIEAQSCELTGSIRKLNEPAVVYLHTGSLIDSCLTKNGMFVFIKNQIPMAGVIEIEYKGRSRKDDFIPIFLDEGSVFVNISSPDSDFLVSVSGSQLTMEYQNKLWLPVNQKNKEIADIGKLFHLSVNNRDGDSVRIAQQSDEAIRQCFAIPKVYIRDNPSSLISIEALKFMGRGDPTTEDRVKELIELFASLSETVRESKAGKEYAVRLKKMMDVKKN